jgi:hypothetical protein
MLMNDAMLGGLMLCVLALLNATVTRQLQYLRSMQVPHSSRT